MRSGGVPRVDPGAGERDQAAHVEEVLHGKRRPGERSRIPPARQRGIHGRGIAQGIFLQQRRETIQRWIAGAYAGEGGDDGLARRDSPRTDVGDYAQGVAQPHGSKTGAVSSPPSGKSRSNSPAVSSPTRFRTTPSRHSGGMGKARRGATSSTYRATSPGSGALMRSGRRPDAGRPCYGGVTSSRCAQLTSRARDRPGGELARFGHTSVAARATTGRRAYILRKSWGGSAQSSARHTAQARPASDCMAGAVAARMRTITPPRASAVTPTAASPVRALRLPAIARSTSPSAGWAGAKHSTVAT